MKSCFSYDGTSTRWFPALGTTAVLANLYEEMHLDDGQVGQECES